MSDSGILKEAWSRRADDRELGRLRRGQDPRRYLVALSRAGRLSELSPKQFFSYLKEGLFEGIPFQGTSLDFIGRRRIAELLKREFFNSGKTLWGADLAGLDFQDFNFFRADLRGVDLSGADFSAADLGGANLQGANLQGTVFRRTDFLRAKMENADFRGANLQGSVLWHAELQGADFRGANIHEADFRSAIYDPSQLEGTVGTPVT